MTVSGGPVGEELAVNERCAVEGPCGECGAPEGAECVLGCPIRADARRRQVVVRSGSAELVVDVAELVDEETGAPFWSVVVRPYGARAARVYPHGSVEEVALVEGSV